MSTWMRSKAEWPAATGRMVFSGIAAEPGALTLAECRERLATIEREIRTSKNRVKSSMNSATIAMETCMPGFEDEGP